MYEINLIKSTLLRVRAYYSLASCNVREDIFYHIFRQYRHIAR